MKKINKKGFTIVELVIVIAVIAILAAVMIPTFSGVISDAKDTSAIQGAQSAYTQYMSENATKEEVAEDFIYVTEGRYVVYKGGKVYTETVDGKTVTAFEGDENDALAAKFNVADDTGTADVDESVTYAATAVDGISGLYTVAVASAGEGA